MKVLFGIDVTENKDNEAQIGDEFVIRKLDEKEEQSLEDIQEELNETVEKSKLSRPLRILETVSGIVGAVIVAGFFRGSMEIGFAKAISNAPILVAFGVASLVLFGVLFYAAKKKEKRIFEELGADAQADQVDAAVKNMYEKLDVPNYAIKFDLLVFRYKEKNGEIKPYSGVLDNTPYMNLDLLIYADEENLYIADVVSVHSFKKSELKYIETIKKTISIPSWNKDIEFNEGEYKQYSIRKNNAGNLFLKPYHILHIERNGEEYGLYFPSYELDTVERLTELVAENK